MILDLNRFIKEGEDVWKELESLLERLNNDPDTRLDMTQIERFHYLYQRTSADLARIMDFSDRQEIRLYLESLVGRAYTHIHENRRKSRRFNVFQWMFKLFPRTFRRHITAFYLSAAIVMAGSMFGAAMMTVDSESKAALMPFAHLAQDPSSRVAREEGVQKDELAGKKSAFASHLIANNTRVSIFALSLGVTWGIGTVIVLFTNGIFLGAVIADYISAGQAVFLTGWLLPHGSIEIPAIILAGQAGLVLAGAMIGRGQPVSFTTRLREVSADLFTLMGGVCLMLVWAGFVESFLSQYHEPHISYGAKIAFGAVQLCLLTAFLAACGRDPVDPGGPENPDESGRLSR